MNTAQVSPAKDLIRSEYQAGKSFGDIANALNTASFKTPSGLTWNADRVISTVGNMKLTRTPKKAAAAPKATKKRAKRAKRTVQASSVLPKAQAVSSRLNFATLTLQFIRDVQASGATRTQAYDMIQAVLSAYNG